MSKEYVPFLKKGGSARLTVSTNGCEETVIVQKKGLPNEVTFYIIHHKPADTAFLFVTLLLFQCPQAPYHQLMYCVIHPIR
jgi:hypothetical protein